MRNSGKVAAIMVGTTLVEATALRGIVFGRTGWTPLWRAWGWGAPPISVLAWAGAAVVAVAYAALSMTSLPYIRRHLFDTAAVKLLAIPFALVTGTVEELFFRKWVMDAVMHHGGSVALQIIASGFVFGVAHAIWGALGGSLRAAVSAMVFTTGLGVALAVVYLMAGRQIAPAIWSHVAINLMIEPWLLLGVMDLRAGARTGRAG